MSNQDVTSPQFYEQFMSTPLDPAEEKQIQAQIQSSSNQITIDSLKIKGQKEKNSLMKDMNRFSQAINSSQENKEKFFKLFKYATIFQKQSQLQQQEYRMFLMQAKTKLGLNIDTGRSIEKHSKAMTFTLAINGEAYFPLLTRLKIIKEGNDPDNLCQQNGVKRLLVFTNEEHFQIPNIKGEMVEVPTGKFIFFKENKTKKSQIQVTQNQQITSPIQNPFQTDSVLVPAEDSFENKNQQAPPLPIYPTYSSESFDSFDFFESIQEDVYFI